MAIILLNSISPGINPSGTAEWGKISGTISNQSDLQSELDAKLNLSEKGANFGVAELDGTGSLTSSQLDSSYVDHNLTTNYVSSQHIDHSSLNLNAGNGISSTGLGNLESSRTINVDIATGSDVSGGVANKILDASKVLDEDSMTSNSDEHVATQQSIVAYVQNQLAGGVTYRGLIVSPADITGSSTGNSYIDTILTYQNGDMFTISSAGETLITVFDGTISVTNGTALIINKMVLKSLVSIADVDVIRTTAVVSSVFGRTGSISTQNGDYTASQITNVASGDISSITVQDAINELDSEKLNNSIVDSKGDLLAASADNVITRLPVGTNGQVLQSDSTEPTGLKYADLPVAKYAFIHTTSDQNVVSVNIVRNWSIGLSTLTGLTISTTDESNDTINLPAGHVYELNFYPRFSLLNPGEAVEMRYIDNSTNIYSYQNSCICSSSANKTGAAVGNLLVDATTGSVSIRVDAFDVINVTGTNINLKGSVTLNGDNNTTILIKTLV